MKSKDCADKTLTDKPTINIMGSKVEEHLVDLGGIAGEMMEGKFHMKGSSFIKGFSPAKSNTINNLVNPSPIKNDGNTQTKNFMGQNTLKKEMMMLTNYDPDQDIYEEMWSREKFWYKFWKFVKLPNKSFYIKVAVNFAVVLNAVYFIIYSMLFLHSTDAFENPAINLDKTNIINND